MTRRLLFLAFCLPALAVPGVHAEPDVKGPADLIVHHAHIVTLDPRSRIFEAVAVKDGRIIALGNDDEIFKLQGPKTRILDADSRTVLPGLYDSHVHPVSAALSEATAPLPRLTSLADAFAYLKKKADTTPKGDWIVLRYAFPTRLKEARFPTREELDKAAPDHPVLYHAGPAGMVNSMGLKVSGITKDTPNPPNGIVVKDPKTGEPTGMLRNAYGVLKGLPGEGRGLSAEQRREALKKLLHLYTSQGLTSVGDRDAGRGDLDLYLSLRDKGELPLRVNVARDLNPHGTREEVVRRLEELPGKDKRGGPTGVGDEWVRIGPIKIYMDGGMLNGTAYMREPWPKGETYQIVEDGYRGLLFLKPEPLQTVVEEAAKRGWRVTAHTAGEGAMDALLDAYELVNRQTPIKDRRFCITHANFPSQENLERCRRLGVCADVQPAWLYKDGATLAKVLGEKRIRWFQPYRSWLQYTTIGGGSDHMIKLDPLEATNPWNPWLGIWEAVTRELERGGVLNPDEALTREQALRLYTINNAYLNEEEKEKGSLEVGKLGDLIVIDQDVLSCPESQIRNIKVLYTVVGGKVVYEAKE
jgi:predicted amidohydrolase YtcJ